MFDSKLAPVELSTNNHILLACTSDIALGAVPEFQLRKAEGNIKIAMCNETTI